MTVLIENEGALLRGPSRSWPTEVWNPGAGWQPYGGAVPKPLEWGDVINGEQARALMAERTAQASSRT